LLIFFAACTLSRTPSVRLEATQPTI
jgi:hypothetical protein